MWKMMVLLNVRLWSGNIENGFENEQESHNELDGWWMGGKHLETRGTLVTTSAHTWSLERTSFKNIKSQTHLDKEFMHSLPKRWVAKIFDLLLLDSYFSEANMLIRISSTWV